MSSIDNLSSQGSGLSQQQRVDQLKAQGIPEQQAMDLVSQQSEIKQAVGGANQPPQGNPGDQVDSRSAGQSNPMDSGAGGPVPPNQFPGGAVNDMGGMQPQGGDPNSQLPGGMGDSMGQPGSGMGDPMAQPGAGQGGPASGEYAASPQGGNYGAPNPGDPYGGQGSDVGGGMAPPPGQGYEDMQPSMMSQDMQQGGGGEYSASQMAGGDYGGESYQDPYGGGAYPMYQPYQEAMSTDMITEISEQIVDEKLSSLQDKIERVLDMRTIVEANMNNLNDRLKRMEKVVDQMQVSILKKVGEYLTDVQDVKKELQETQKSFVAIQKNKGKKHKKKEHKK